MVSLALGTSNGVEANNGINDLSPAPEAKKTGSRLCYKISVVAALVLGLLAAAGGAVVLALFCTLRRLSSSMQESFWLLWELLF